jgi:hypothetical protein
METFGTKFSCEKGLRQRGKSIQRNKLSPFESQKRLFSTTLPFCQELIL